jgi:starch synthase (maltosyl-transferring)
VFPVKRIAGEAVAVTADLLFDGHEKIAGAVRWRGAGGGLWQEIRMRPLGNDRWQAEFPLTLLGRYEYVVSTWRDEFETFRDEIAKKHAAGVDITVELEEGVALVKRRGGVR